MKNSTEYKVNQGRGIGLLGGYATGKTSFALEFPKPYLYDADNNCAGALERAHARGITFKYDIGNITDDDKEVPISYRYELMIKRLKEAFASPDVDTVIIDGASAVSDYIIAYILKKNLASAMSMQLWGLYLERWKLFISWTRSQGKLIILTMHEQYEKDELEGTIAYEVSLPGQISRKIGTYMSDLYRHEIQTKKSDAGEESSYVVRTRPNSKVKLRCSFPTMPPLLKNDNVEELYKGLGLPVPNRKKK
jgi:hypothetical protein